MWTQFSWKNSLLGICKILGLFVNPLTADDKYFLLNRDNLEQHFQIQLSHKQKIFSECFFEFSKLWFNFEYFQKKWPSKLMYFWAYRLWKTWLDKRLKSPVSEDSSTSNMVKGPKQIAKLKDITFTIFIDWWEGNSGWKILSERYANS